MVKRIENNSCFGEYGRKKDCKQCAVKRSCEKKYTKIVGKSNLPFGEWREIQKIREQMNYHRMKWQFHASELKSLAQQMPNKLSAYNKLMKDIEMEKEQK